MATTLTGNQGRVGDISKFGVDIGYSGALIAWAVLAPSAVGKGPPRFVRRRHRCGPRVRASVRIVLLGGFKVVQLAAVSVGASTGLNAAAHRSSAAELALFGRRPPLARRPPRRPRPVPVWLDQCSEIRDWRAQRRSDEPLELWPRNSAS
jgi:hypothetical protein